MVPLFRGSGVPPLIIGLLALPLFCGCAAEPQAMSDGQSAFQATGFPGFAGKRVAILSFDEAVVSELPDALALKPAAPQPGETQKAAELRRLADFRRLGDLFAPDETSAWSDGRRARGELFQHAFTAALLERKIEIVERQRIARVLGEQRLNGEDDPMLTPERRAQQFGVDLKACDYVIVGNPIVDRVAFDYSVTPLALVHCILIVPIFLIASESADLSAAQDEGSLAVANAAWHDVSMRQILGVSARAIDVKTGEIVWIGTAWGCADHPSGLSGLVGETSDATISEVAEIEALAKRLVATIGAGGGAPAAR